MKLSETTVKKSNNLQLMRFIAAVMVIFAHSYAISGSVKGSDFIDRYTGGIISIGGISVTLFFLCSGYLISKSIMRTKGFLPYIKARLIRLLPPLWLVVIASVILGAVITTLSLKEYVTNFGTYKYFLNGFTLPIHNLPGVFENNAYGPVVNGALWTLSVELACYVACYIFYALKLLDKKRLWWTLPAVILVLIFEGHIPGFLGSMVRPCVFFYIGMLYYVYREHIELNIKIVPFATIALIAAFLVPQLIKPAMIILWPYILFTLWFAVPQCSERLGKLGDISYGIYLWGFVIQQFITYLWGGSMPQMLNFALSAVAAIVLSIATYLIAEKPFIKKKV